MPSVAFLLTNWSLPPLTGLVLLSIGLLYGRGWLRMRQRTTDSRARVRLFAFALGWLLMVIAFCSPLSALRTELLLARTIQQILLGLLAAPLLWLGAPAQTIRWGLPGRWRRRFTRLLRPDSRTGQGLRAATRPAAVWLATIASFLVWADPLFVEWSIADGLRYSASLWCFWLVYTLFWMHVVKTGPRLHRMVPPGIGFFYVLVGGEIPNMITGATTAFRENLLYPFYAGGSSTVALSPLLDQSISGCLMWVVGTVIYVSICLAILGQVFRNEDAPPPMPVDWQATERTIAPGLEHRVSPRRQG